MAGKDARVTKEADSARLSARRYGHREQMKDTRSNKYILLAFLLGVGGVAAAAKPPKAAQDGVILPGLIRCATLECYVREAELVFVGRVVDYGDPPNTNNLCGSIYILHQNVTYRVEKVLKGWYKPELLQVEYVTCGCEFCDGNNLSSSTFAVDKRLIIGLMFRPKETVLWKNQKIDFSHSHFDRKHSPQLELEITRLAGNSNRK